MPGHDQHRARRNLQQRDGEPAEEEPGDRTLPVGSGHDHVGVGLGCQVRDGLGSASAAGLGEHELRVHTVVGQLLDRRL
jgi:hypothetical protein